MGKKILGNKIRLLRTEKKITLKELADKVNVTPSLISQIERGIANPSISSLKSISDYLGVTIAELLDTSANNAKMLSPVIKRGQHKLMITGSGSRYSLLNPGDMDTEVILVEFPPGSSTGKMSYEHFGYECGYILEGELSIELEDEKYDLFPGDSISFSSQMRHKVTNLKGNTARAIWVNSTPWIFPKYKENKR